MEGRSSYPSTLLYTDIAGSTRLWEANPSQMYSCLSAHDTIVTETVASHNGEVFKSSGDSFCCIFHSAYDAVSAAIGIQIKLGEEQWPVDTCIQIRVALHSGIVEQCGSELYGAAVSRTSQLLGTAHAGQILISQATRDLLTDLPADTTILDLGEHRLQDLAEPETVYQLVHAKLQHSFPSLNSLTNVQNNLPRQLTSFVGRTKEITEVKRLLNEARMLSIIGMGGCGKSRLSLQVAAEMVHVFNDGVWFVELAVLSNPTQILPAVASALGIPETGGTDLLQSLLTHVADKRLLIILDNCEHLIQAVTSFVTELLNRIPTIKIVATSRERLNIPAETVYRIPTLSVPLQNTVTTIAAVMEYESVQLFLDRANSQAAEFLVNEENAELLGSLCRKLDGIPLAIELAASRVRTMGLNELHRRMEQRFRLLTGGGRTVIGRQQTLKGLIDWSYDLLTADEQRLLQYSAIFRGSCTRESISYLYTGSGRDISDLDILLSSLVEESLLNFDGTRFSLLETVREYAFEKLSLSSECPMVQKQHHNWFLSIAEKCSETLNGEFQKAALLELSKDYDNIREAVLYSKKHNLCACKFGRAMKKFWEKSGRWTEGRLLLAEILQDVDESVEPLDHAGCLYTLGSLTYFQSQYQEACEILGKSLEIYRSIADVKGISSVLNMLGNIAVEINSYDEAESRYLEALELYRQSGDLSGEAVELGNLGALASDQHNYQLARKYGEQALSIHLQTGNKSAEIYSHILLGICGYYEGDYSYAKVEFEKARQIGNEIGEMRIEAAMLFNLGHLQREQGDNAGAENYYSNVASLCVEMGNRNLEADALDHLALVAAYREDYTSAKEYFRKVDEVVLALQSYNGNGRILLHKMELALYECNYPLAEKLGTAALRVNEDIADKNAIIFTIVHLSLLNLMKMEYDASREGICKAVQLALVATSRQPLLESLFVCTLFLHRIQDYENAGRCCGTTETLRESIGIVLSPQKRRMWMEMRVSLQNTLGVMEFGRLCKEGSECPPEEMANQLLKNVVHST